MIETNNNYDIFNKFNLKFANREELSQYWRIHINEIELTPDQKWDFSKINIVVNLTSIGLKNL